MAAGSRGLREHLATLGWAFYLGASWTWCIGMLLPVILVRDYGAWTWLLFAVPNVAGAAAMGWVLRNREASVRLVREHRHACVAFSLATVAYHWFFLGWITALLPAGWVGCGYGVLLIVYLAGLRDEGRDLAGAALVTGISIAVLVRLLVAVPVGEQVRAMEPLVRGGLPLVWFAPAFFFGFLLCPYLDLTFHRARQANSAPRARAAFTVGFGGIFLLMILLSLLYAVPMAQGRPARLIHLIGFHMVVQSGFTTVLHLRRLLPAAARMRVRTALACVGLAAALFLLAPVIHEAGLRYGDVDGREVVYWLFLAPYGVVFPAYVWFAMVTARSGEEGAAVMSRRRLLLFAATVLVALPAYWMGFVEREPVWLMPGVGVVLLSGWATRRLGEGRPE